MSECKHRFRVLDTSYKTEHNWFNTKFIRITTYYCEKCLKEVTKEKVEYSRETPAWFKRSKDE